MKCQNCGREVTNEDATFCPYCAKPIKVAVQKKRTPFPIAAGILTIISSCTAIGIGLLYVFSALVSSGYGYGYINGFNAYFLFIGIFGIMAFAFSLSAGIFVLKRSHIAFSIFGLAFLLTSGILMSSPIFVFGIPIIILSILSIIFVAISKAEFN